MLTQLREILPQHLTLLNNLTVAQNRKLICGYIVKGTGKAETDFKIFNVVAKFICESNRFNI